MTFCPEWLIGSPSLGTSLPLNLWVYLVFFNGLWVVIPVLLLWHSWTEIKVKHDMTVTAGKKKRKWKLGTVHTHISELFCYSFTVIHVIYANSKPGGMFDSLFLVHIRNGRAIKQGWKTLEQNNATDGCECGLVKCSHPHCDIQLADILWWTFQCI